MNLTTRAARRVLAATAITCAAILVPAIALAASGGSAASVRAAAPAAAAGAAGAAVPECPASAILIWRAAGSDGSAGSSTYFIELSNVSRHTCTLLGFPGVSAVGRNGRQVGSAALRDHADPERLVTLGPGGTAHVLLQVSDVGSSSGCHPAHAAGLRIYPPNDTVSTVIPLSFLACSKHGPRFMFVRTTVARPGIPGFSS